MSTNSHQSAFPGTYTSGENESLLTCFPGMSKREYGAMLAMQGILASNPEVEYGDYGKKRMMSLQDIANRSVLLIDALIEQLDKTKS